MREHVFKKYRLGDWIFYPGPAPSVTLLHSDTSTTTLPYETPARFFNQRARALHVTLNPTDSPSFVYDYTTLKLYCRFQSYERFTRLSLIGKSTGVNNFKQQGCRDRCLLFTNYFISTCNKYCVWWIWCGLCYVELMKSGLQSWRKLIIITVNYGRL